MANITATCACGAFKFLIEYPADSFPFHRALCLCNSCRKVTGSSGGSYIRLHENQRQLFDPKAYNLQEYNSSEGLIRYFCRSCGAHVGWRSFSGDATGIATGLWDNTEDTIQWSGCKWIEDTLDGGISVWLNNIVDPSGEKRHLKRWLQQDGENALVPDNTLETYVPSKTSKQQEKLHASCHCGGVEFYITRPNEASVQVHAPYSDLIVPYHCEKSAENPDNETWWLRSNNTKYMAGTCTCKSCRLASGMEFQPWAFVPKCNILQVDGKPLEYSMGTLKTYDSSDGVWRDFCGVCGATVFWRCRERLDLVDVSVGLFDPTEGARAEAWLEWWSERVSFQELAVSQSLVGSLETGLKSWKQTQKK